jgi:hypothetical protein
VTRVDLHECLYERGWVVVVVVDFVDAVHGRPSSYSCRYRHRCHDRGPCPCRHGCLPIRPSRRSTAAGDDFDSRADCCRCSGDEDEEDDDCGGHMNLRDSSLSICRMCTVAV